MTDVRQSAELGLRFGPLDQGDIDTGVRVHLAAVNQRVLDLARRQSADIEERLVRENVNLVTGRGRLDGRTAAIDAFSGTKLPAVSSPFPPT
jgi:dihydrolipoamide dehydrogenase